MVNDKKVECSIELKKYSLHALARQGRERRRKITAQKK
jgi:hypothetical protein